MAFEKQCPICKEWFKTSGEKHGMKRVCCSMKCSSVYRSRKYRGNNGTQAKPLPMHVTNWSGNLREVMGVYQIRNLVTNKVYIGSSRDIHKRFRQHYERLTKGKHRNINLQREFNEFGLDLFEWSVLEVIQDQKQLLNREQHWLDFKHACEVGYNESPSAYGTKGYKFRDEPEFRKRLSDAHKGMRPAAKITEKQVIEICEMMKRGMGNADISRALNLPNANISRIRQGRTWTHITIPYKQEREVLGIVASKGRKGSRQVMSKLDESDIVVIWNRLLNGDGLSQIGRDYNVAPQTIRSIKIRKNWTHVTNSL